MASTTEQLDQKAPGGTPMTYCVGILVRDGLVMIADTRTNAGVDNIATFRKLHLFEKPGERIITPATAGNLSASQSVMSILTEGLENPETGVVETLLTVPSMFKAAQLVGRAIRQVYEVDGIEIEKRQMTFDVTMLLGGRSGRVPCGSIRSMRPAMPSRPPSIRPSCRSASPNTANRSSTGRFPTAPASWKP
jgi:hypothetical protein